MNAVEFSAPVAGVLAERGLASGFVLNAIGTHILRFLPPLVCTSADIDVLLDVLDSALSNPAVTAVVEADRAQEAQATSTSPSDERSPR